MTTFTIIFASAVTLWLWLTILAALFLAGAADDLYDALRRKENRKAHKLGKLLRFHGKI